MKRSRRVHRRYDSTRAPEAITEAKRKVVTPPSTGFGTMVLVRKRERSIGRRQGAY